MLHAPGLPFLPVFPAAGAGTGAANFAPVSGWQVLGAPGPQPAAPQGIHTGCRGEELGLAMTSGTSTEWTPVALLLTQECAGCLWVSEASSWAHDEEVDQTRQSGSAQEVEVGGD